MQSTGSANGFLGPGDPVPFELVNEAGASPFVLTCEHAGRAVPRRIGDLGLADADRDRHITWDVGADGVARGLSRRLDAPLVLQPYSRLVVDCNRPFHAPDCIPLVSDGTPVPANAGLDNVEQRARFDAIHTPFHGQVARLLDARPLSVLVAVHSFTPRLATDGIPRPWHAGLLFNADPTIAHMLLPELEDHAPQCRFALNEPYSVDNESDFTIPEHGERRGIAHVLLEVRNDEISDRPGEDRWAELLASTLAAIETRAVSEARKRDAR